MGGVYAVLLVDVVPPLAPRELAHDPGRGAGAGGRPVGHVDDPAARDAPQVRAARWSGGVAEADAVSCQEGFQGGWGQVLVIVVVVVIVVVLSDSGVGGR